jgi:hypothetical protein
VTVVALPDTGDVRLDYTGAGALNSSNFTLRFTSNVGAITATVHASWAVFG